MLRVLLTVLLCAGATTTAALAQDRVVPSHRVTTFVYIRTAPNTASEEKGQLRPGDRLPLVNAASDWYAVRLPDGSTGFVSKDWTTVERGLPTRQLNDLRIHFLNVGAGTCTVVECPGPNAAPMIVDCGSSGGTADDLTHKQTSAYVQEILKANPERPNVVLSHGDTDHYAFIPAVLSTTTAQHIWQGGQHGDYGSHGFADWLQAQVTNGADLHGSFAPHWHNNRQAIGSHLSCGLANTFVLTVNSGASKNAQSLVLMVQYGSFAAVFSGDAEGVTESQALQNYQGKVKTTVLTASHHGASTLGSNGEGWAKALAPDVLISSAGTRYYHPRCMAVNRFTTLADALEHDVTCGTSNAYESSRTNRAHYVTEINGAIVITTDGESPPRLHCTRSEECGLQVAHE